MKNEVLCKILAHILCACIAEWYTLGIEPAFGAVLQDDEPTILPMQGRG